MNPTLLPLLIAFLTVHEPSDAILFVHDATPPGAIIDHGHQRMGDTWDRMGDFELQFDAAGRRWSGEWSNSRVHLERSGAWQGTDLVGTLATLPERRKGRDMAVPRPTPPAR